MISKVGEYRRDKCIPFFLKMWPKKKYAYGCIMRKIEGDQKMIGRNGTEGAVVSCWRLKFSDMEGNQKKEGVCCPFIHKWQMLCHFVDIKQDKIKFTNVSNVVMEHCIQNGEDKMAINDCPTNVKNLHLFIKELDKNSGVGTDLICLLFCQQDLRIWCHLFV